MHLSQAYEDDNYDYLYNYFSAYPSYNAFYDDNYDDIMRGQYGYEVMAIAYIYYGGDIIDAC